MKNLLFLALAFCAVATLPAHDHIEVGVDPAEPTRLGLSGPQNELALYVPPGEPFSAYLPDFPGGSYPVELTFSAEGDVLEFAEGARAKIELVSVAGPENAHFSFWEIAASAPTWTRPTGWSAVDGDRPSLLVYDDPTTGYGHIHGRAFSVDRPGTYQVVFRAVDNASVFAPSLNKTVTFIAQNAPQLSIRLQDGNAVLAFTSRNNLTYDLQVSTTLAADDWSTIDWTDGTGGNLEFSDSLNNRPRVFYRLVEYR